MIQDIKPGIIGEADETVSDARTAAFFGSGLVAAYGTPALIALMESAQKFEGRPVVEVDPDSLVMDRRHNGVDLAGGASTLALGSANLVGRLRLTTANVEGSISGRRASYVLPAGTALLLVAVTGTANITGTVTVHFEA